MALTQEQVVKRAVELLAEAGLEALTLRRLATELGVSAPTLYWHVRDKRELLELMAQALVARADPTTSPAPGQPWWAWLAERARRQFRALSSHRDAALVVAGNHPTQASLAEVEEALGSLVTVGFPPAEALGVVLSIGNYVIGCAVERQTEDAAPSADPDRHPRLQAQALPNLRAAIADSAGPGPWAGDAGFEYGLGLLLDGVRARHAALLNAPPGHPAPTGQPATTRPAPG
jgi:TetR/AcrR family transcriptional regulator, tetracycline repressor protein